MKRSLLCNKFLPTLALAPIFLAMAAGSVLPCSPAIAAETAPIFFADGIVAESLGDRVVRFHASPDAREAAHPSYALASEPKQSPVTTAPTVVPVFGTQGGKATVRVTVPAGTSMYGTGEVAGPLLRNGRKVTAWNTDAYGYGDEATSLYKSHPWVLCVRPDGTSFGILADTTYRCTIDTGATSPNEVTFTADGPAFPAIIIERARPDEVVQELGRLTGLMPLPAKWTLGYHQCRYSYYPEARVREIASGFRERDIPCDVIWYDIDYYETFRCFTFDRSYFPGPKKLNADLLADGFHNVWMINPGIKATEEPSPNEPPAEQKAKESAELKAAREAEKNKFRAIRDSGLKQDVYVKNAAGKTYQGEVWPGWCYFPDYTSPRVREWWAPHYAPFMAEGVTGVWNDMNEPAVFNVPSKTMPEDNIHAGDPDLIKPNGKPQGVDEAKGNHARYHNVYGLTMVKGSREGIQAANPDKRPFVLSRATYIGGQRYHAGWSGDNTANWYHLEASIPMVLNMGLSGFSFYGPDIGGFAANGDGELFERWMGFGALLPFSRGHTGKGNIDKEPWSFGPEVEETCRLAIQRRYRFLPYIYTKYYEASTNGMPVAQPMFFADPTDPALRSEDDGFLLGRDILVVASVMPDMSRVVTLPKGNWQQFDFAVPAGTKNTTKGRDGTNTKLPKLYARPGAIIPTGEVVEFSGAQADKPLTLIVNLDESGKAIGTLYEDAGDGYGYVKGDFLLSTYEASTDGNSVTVKLAKAEGDMPRPSRDITVRVLPSAGHPTERIATGKDGDSITIK